MKNIDHPKNLVNTGIYAFSRDIFKYTENVLDIPDALNNMIGEGCSLKAVETSGTWLDVIYPWDVISLNHAILTSIKEIKARRSPVIAIVSEGDDNVSALADYTIAMPEIDPLFSPVTNSVALQLLAYYVAKARGLPIDFPRNLAKSVTVE
jgi:NDP-sugar pyrophosphorylase family protein